MEKSTFLHEGFLFTKEHVSILKSKLNYLLEDLKNIHLDVELKNIFITYFGFYIQTDPSANQSTYYAINLIQAIRRAIHNTDKDTIEINLLEYLVLYDFNHGEIIEYYLRKIKLCLDNNPAAEQDSIEKLLLISQNLPIYRYKSNRNTLGDHIRTYLLARLDIMEIKALGILPGNQKSIIIQFDHPPRIFMLFIRLAFETGVIKRTKTSRKLFKFLSEILRGPDGKDYAENTLNNTYLYNNEKSLDRTIEVLDKMKARAEEAKVEIRDRLGHVK